MAQPCVEETLAAMLGDDLRDPRLIRLRGRGAERQCHLRQAQLEQPVAAPGLAVVITLRHGPRDDLDLAIIEAKAAIDGGDLRLDCPLVRQQQPRLAAFDDGGRDGASVDVGERLRGENDAGVLLAQRLQPFAKLAGEALVVECQPAFIDDDERRRSVEPILDAVEELGQNGGRGLGADQPLGLEGLHRRSAEMLGLGVQQPAPGPADAVWPERLFQVVGLQQDAETGDRAFLDRRRSQ